MKGAYWFNCSDSKNGWVSGEYLIESVTGCGISILFKNQVSILGCKSFKSAKASLQKEFHNIKSIKRWTKRGSRKPYRV